VADLSRVHSRDVAGRGGVMRGKDRRDEALLGVLVFAAGLIPFALLALL
jgi:hypothetical protein